MGLELDFKLIRLVLALQARLGRIPTEEEIMTFINGSEEERREIWGEE